MTTAIRRGRRWNDNGWSGDGETLSRRQGCWPRWASRHRRANQGLQGATPPEDLAAAGLGPDGAPLVGASPDVMPLARVELSNGNTIEFVGVRGDSKEPEVGMRELGQLDRATGATFAAERDVTALELYLRLAPKDAPVPDMLLELNPAVERKAFKHRTVERVEDAIEVDLDELGIAPDIARAGPSSGGGPGQAYCVPGMAMTCFATTTAKRCRFPVIPVVVRSRCPLLSPGSLDFQSQAPQLCRRHQRMPRTGSHPALLQECLRQLEALAYLASCFRVLAVDPLRRLVQA